MTRYHLLSLLGLLFLLSACAYVTKIKTGDMAYDRKQYSVAVKLLTKEYEKAKTRKEKGNIAWYMAESYKELNQSEKSIIWYQRAYDNQADEYLEALKEYALALKEAERYEEAIQAFKDLGVEIGSPYEYRREIQACEVSAGWKKIEEPDYSVELMDFNSGFADYSPVVYENNQLVFTSDRKLSEGEEIYNWTGNEFSDLFVIDLETKTVNSFDNVINTEDNEGTIAFNPSYTEMYFTRCFGSKKEDSYCKIMRSLKTGEGWGPPEVLSFIQANVNYGHPALSVDGNRLYFSSNHPDGFGGFDIYVSLRVGNDWDEPQLLHRTINSVGNEKFPYLDGDTLYFASDFHTGMGGLDIFRSYRLPNGSWSSPYNLKPPINSGGDDFGFVIDRFAKLEPGVMQTGYFTSTRELGIGNDDIYRFERRIPPPPPIEEVVPEPEEVVYQIILNGYVLEKIFEDEADPNSKVLGRRPLDSAGVSAQLQAKEIETFTVGEDGFFTMELDLDRDYSFIGSKEGYLSNVTDFSTKDLGLDPENPVQTYEIEIVLDKIFLNKEIVLENIYYDFDKWDIREDAQPTLNELAGNLKLNPNINIQMASHTDCRGSTRYNEELSQKRAQSAVNYLISQGVDPGRLTAKGFGENQLEVDCVCSRCTEEQHQENRRTTFAIIE